MPAVVHEIAAPATSWDSYFSITALSTYSSLSARRLARFSRLPITRCPTTVWAGASS